MFLTGKHLSRRTVLRGLGADDCLAALRLDDSCAVGLRADGHEAGSRPHATGVHRTGARRGRVQRIRGVRVPVDPAAAGRAFDLGTGSLSPLEPFRDYLTIVSNTDARMAEAFTPAEVGGDHFRSSAVMFTHAHPKLTEGSDVRVGTSMDQLYVQRFGQDTPIPSMQLSIEPVDQSGGCAYGYACVYTDTISWAAPDEPLPMVRDPRHGVRAAFRRRRHARAAGRSAVRPTAVFSTC